MKTYLFFLNTDLLPPHMEDCGVAEFIKREIDGEEYCLYAYTTNKHHKQRFLRERSDDFIMLVRDLPKETFTEDFQYFELFPMIVEMEYTLLVTHMEQYHLELNWAIIIEDDLLKGLENIVQALPKLRQMHREKLISMGTTLLYCMLVNDEDVDEYSCYTSIGDDDSILYGQMFLNPYMNNDTWTDVALSPNVANLFVHVFYDLLRHKKT